MFTTNSMNVNTEENLYKDPENASERDKIIEKLSSMETMGDIKRFVDENYPNFILGFIDKFSSDYSILENNWKKFCIYAEIEKMQIMIVNHYDFNNNSKVFSTIAEIFSKCGFLVRRKYDIIPCLICGDAIPSREWYDVMKKYSNSDNIPNVWTDRCKMCT